MYGQQVGVGMVVIGVEFEVEQVYGVDIEIDGIFGEIGLQVEVKVLVLFFMFVLVIELVEVVV